jgi:hypothetical protein
MKALENVDVGLGLRLEDACSYLRKIVVAFMCSALPRKGSRVFA